MSTQMEYDKWIFVAPPQTLEFTYGWWGGGGGGGALGSKFYKGLVFQVL